MLDSLHRACDWLLYQTLSAGFAVVDSWRGRRRRMSLRSAKRRSG
jgi:hypothetical protein